MPHSHELSAEQVLSVQDLNVGFRHEGQQTRVVRDLSFSLARGETLAIVGESGSGKSVTALALMRLLSAQSASIKSGPLLLRRRNRQVVDLRELSDARMRGVRGADVAMIFQEPMTSLNPVFTIGEQIAESIRLHQGMSHKEALNDAKRMLDLVRIPDAKAMLRRYPHQLSGGMRQRVMIAMALSCRPAVLIADEPTTALDVTIQAQILQLIKVLQREMAMGVIFITHDMGVVADIADRVLVMYRGEAVESGDVRQIFSAPQHPYTQSLLAAVPRLGAMNGSTLPRKFPLTDPNNPDAPLDEREQDTVVPGAAPILQVRDLVTRFVLRGGIFNRVQRVVHAVEKVSFDLLPGETLGLVGESGCGKSTTGRSLLRLVESQSGAITFEGQRIDGMSSREMRALRRDIQVIFQDPYASLDPRNTVGDAIMEPMRLHGASRQEASARTAWLLERVGLSPEHAVRYPHEFSGGQRQRICIARALALNPKVVIADEAVSALDVSIRAQIVNLMLSLQRELGIAFLFISHDMAVVERICHRVAVMYLGQIVEIGPRQAVFENPQHPYTRRLMAAVPVADPSYQRPQGILLSDEIASAARRPGDEPEVVPMVEVGPGHYVARTRAEETTHNHDNRPAQ
ncbi:glutathione ABC transporter ATP-binding protein GsiA [Jejubacter calystegiae]|uniref:Glutathione import ATP-binding protein GsiA n=1 Tax=Jejubacter calystegiae TaxID=2579935 RepID=A0A4P8YJ48_9ENTR|nr:glutathione ABC transporter ATP-binding protein GsiA [Jejubacter calystegiae]QCT20680.1 glutathione ABC transporter ATP-binding protein GsiA [Jejubacter calystegiae]